MLTTDTRVAARSKISYSWDGPAIDDENDPGWNERIELIIRHDTDRKRYTATLYKVAARREAGYTMTRFEVFGSPTATVLTKPVGRFSEKSFLEFEAGALNICAQLIEADYDTTACDLLRQASAYALV